ncbi:MAG: hypothetical protein WA906_11390 [Pacificimonas sp.]
MLAQLIVSIAGIAAIVAIAWWLFGRTPSEPMTEEDAVRTARALLPAFDPVEAVCGRDGRGALLRGSDGGIALLRPVGDHVSARFLTQKASATINGDELRVRTGEAMFGTTSLRLGHDDAKRWAELLKDQHGLA